MLNKEIGDDLRAYVSCRYEPVRRVRRAMYCCEQGHSLGTEFAYPYCPHCGAKVISKCPSCGCDLQYVAGMLTKYCAMCGEALSEKVRTEKASASRRD